MTGPSAGGRIARSWAPKAIHLAAATLTLYPLQLSVTFLN
jgi:hypothetical protein